MRVGGFVHPSIGPGPPSHHHHSQHRRTRFASPTPFSFTTRQHPSFRSLPFSHPPRLLLDLPFPRSGSGRGLQSGGTDALEPPAPSLPLSDTEILLSGSSTPVLDRPLRSSASLLSTPIANSPISRQRGTYRSLSLSPRPCRPFLPNIEASCPVRVLLHTRVLYLALPLELHPPPLSVRMSIAQT
jgi:hypothetical protein